MTYSQIHTKFRLLASNFEITEIGVLLDLTQNRRILQNTIDLIYSY